MAFPFQFESNFEVGSNAEWTSETDTSNQLDVAHASTLAQTSGLGSLAPFRGAYCARWQLATGNTNDAYFNTTGIDIGDGATSYFRWYIFLGLDFAFSANDIISLLKLRQAGAGTVEYTVGLSCTTATDLIVLGGSDGVAAAAFGSKPLRRNYWHCIEVLATVSTGGTGVITTWLDGVQQNTSTSQTQAAAVGDGELGISDKLSTTSGTVLMDCFVQDDARIYPIVDRYPTMVLLTKSGHVFIGPGVIENVQLYGGSSTDSVVSVFDTNRGNSSDANKIGQELKVITASDVQESLTEIQVTRGCYVKLSGTAPRALVNIELAPGYGSPGAVRNVASRLKQKWSDVL